jgi:hypothetical protein
MLADFGGDDPAARGRSYSARIARCGMIVLASGKSRLLRARQPSIRAHHLFGQPCRAFGWPRCFPARDHVGERMPTSATIGDVDADVLVDGRRSMSIWTLRRSRARRRRGGR